MSDRIQGIPALAGGRYRLESFRQPVILEFRINEPALTRMIKIGCLPERDLFHDTEEY